MMKRTLNTVMAVFALMVGPTLEAEEKKAGPNGGRIIEVINPHLEFLVMPDRKLKLIFLGEDGKPVAVKDQSAKGIGGDRTNPTRFTFVREGDVLVSDLVLPEGKRVPLILHLKGTPDAKTVTEKFTVDLSDCSSCDYLEYACTCGH